MPDYMNEFDDDFEFKDLPDESTPHNAQNMGRALKNTRLLKRFINDVITGNVDLVVRSIKSVNLFDYEYIKNYNNTILSTYRFVELKGLKPNTEYIFYNYDYNNFQNTENLDAIFLAREPNFGSINLTNCRIYTQTTSANEKIIISTDETGKMYLGFYPGSMTVEIWSTFISNFEKAMLVEGTEEKEYGPHQF